jgi:hypothetical protein
MQRQSGDWHSIGWDSLHYLQEHSVYPIASPSVMANYSNKLGGAMNEVKDQSQVKANHIYTVELRFYGDELEPSEISRRLCLNPTNSSDISIASSKERKIRPFWAYDGQGEHGFQSEWYSLEDGVNFLLGRLMHLRETVVELSQTFEGIWWCGHFQSSFDGGPTLPSNLLAEIASYGLPIFIDNYFEIS